MINGKAEAEFWELKEPFVISRGRRTHAQTVSLSLTDGVYEGRGECQPNSRYNETQEAVTAMLNACFPASLDDLRRHAETLPSMAARNALDCALWDLQCKQEGISVWEKAGLVKPETIHSYFTLSVGTPEAMAQAAKQALQAGRPSLKLKFSGDGDDERLIAVREAVPDAGLIIDANEAWSDPMLIDYVPLLEKLGVLLLEQPLPAGKDDLLAEMETPVTLCADESCHTVSDLEKLAGKYDAVNIKLDKTGGFTPGIALLQAAQQAEFRIMVGCMLGTSLAIAPACLLAAQADFVDMDAPVLLKEDRAGGCRIDAAMKIYPAKATFWG